MSVERNKAMVLKLWESVNRGDLVGIAAMYHENVIYNGSAFVVEGLILTGWLLAWRPIHRCNLAIRCILALICWIVTAVNIGLFSVVIR